MSGRELANTDTGLTSIIILGFNEIEYTKLCITSIFNYTERPFELILVDNGSSDGTGAYFDSLLGAEVIKNATNLGFAKGCNQGIKAASGEYVLLLNNDTIVTPNWLDNMIDCMESDPKIGMVGPMSNFVAGPQRIEVPYESSLETMLDFAEQFNEKNPLKYTKTDTLIGFCLLIRRQVIEEIGLLDERFGLGNYEDNDYCVRVRLAGYKLIRTGDTFVHHFGNRTFVGNSIDWYELMTKNKKLYNEKWGLDKQDDDQDLSAVHTSLIELKGKLTEKDFDEDNAEANSAELVPSLDRDGKTPTLSLTMIVKDEEDNIGRCLESVQGVADEIIVVDTGSTDRTVEIAKSFGAKIYFHRWNDDFAEARNISLDHATCEWVMFLDADEELQREDVAKLRELLEDPEKEGFYFSELNFIGEKEEDGAIVNLAFRLWRNKPEYRFSCAIHEQIVAKVQSYNPNVGFSSVRIKHYGYMNKATIKKNKVQRNLDILLREVERNPEDSFIRFNLGVEYLRLNEHEMALNQYKKAFENLSGLDAAYASMLVRNIALCLRELEKYDEALQILKDAKEAYPDYTDLYYLEGLIYIGKKDFSCAIKCFKTCLDMGPSAKFHISQTGVGGYMAARALASCHKALGDEKEAFAAYKKALEDNNRDCLSLLEFGLMLIRREDPNNLKDFLEQLVDLSSEDMLYALSFIFGKGGYHDIGLTYLNVLVDISTNPSKTALLRGEGLLNLKRYKEAILELDKVSEASRYYPAASIDRAVCYMLESEYDNAASAIDLIKESKDYDIIHYLYRSLIDTVQGLPVSPSISISAKNKQKEQVQQIIVDILRKLLELGEFESFERAIKLLEQLDYSSGEIKLLLGKIYYDLGYIEMAVDELILAHGSGSADGESFYILGKTAFNNELYEEAREFFYEALNRGIKDLTLYISLSRTLMKLGEIDRAADVIDAGTKEYPESTLLAEVKQSVGLILPLSK